MLDPPGTMRTPLCAVKLLHRVGGLIEERLARGSTDISTMPPMRKPSRMPFFTQAFTRQPVGATRIGLGGAHAALRSARL